MNSTTWGPTLILQDEEPGGPLLCLHLNPPENRLRIDTVRDGEQSQKLEQVPCFGAEEIRPEFAIL